MTHSCIRRLNNFIIVNITGIAEELNKPCILENLDDDKDEGGSSSVCPEACQDFKD